MKKSNKLLVAGFAIVILLATALHLTLYANYKKGNYTTVTEDPQSIRSFPAIRYVSIKDLPDAAITFGDVAQVKKTDEKNVLFIQRGDSLVITGPDPNSREQMLMPVAITLPYNTTLQVANSHLFVTPGKTPAASSPVIYLQQSQLVFSGEKGALLFDHVKVAASDSSTVLFQGNTQVTDLAIQLSNSAIEHKEGKLGQLFIITDSISRIGLQSKHLFNAKITTATPE